MDLDTFFPLTLLGVAPIVGVLGTLYIYRIYQSDQRRPRSWLLLMALASAVFLVLVSVYLGWISALRISGGADAVPTWTLPITIATTVMAGCLPAIWAYYMYNRGGTRQQ